MKTLTEMKRKNPALTFAKRYSSILPQKLNFSIVTTTNTGSFKKKITRKKQLPTLSTSLSPEDATKIESSFLSSECLARRQSGLPCDEVSRLTALEKPQAPGGGAAKTTQKKSTTKSSKRKKDHVLFQDRDEIFGIGSREDISPEERKQIWYSREEYDQILQACSKQISMLDRGQHLKDKKFCARGLESHTRVQAVTKSMNRCLAYQAVLFEQDRQSSAGVVVLDDEKIAQLYNATSYSCQLWARAVGLADQREAQDIQDESDQWYQEGGWGLLAEQSSRKLSAEHELCDDVVPRIPEELVARAA